MLCNAVIGFELFTMSAQIKIMILTAQLKEKLTKKM